MLHILWLIIKCILILLGIVAGLILLILLLLLFCPVRYRARAEKERAADLKETEVSGEVSWLFHGIAVKAFLRNGTPEFEFYILGIALSKLKRLFHRKKKNSYSRRNGKAKVKKASRPQKSKKIREDRIEEDRVEDPKPRVKIIDESDAGKSDTEESSLGKIRAAVDDDTSSKTMGAGLSTGPDSVERITEDMSIKEYDKDNRNIHDIPDTEPQTENRVISLIFKITGKIKKTVSSLFAVIRRLLGIPSRIFKKIQNIRLTIKKFCGKINWYKEFIDHPRTREAISFVWKGAKKLLHHILPTRITGKITFGNEDPAITGTVLAVMGMTIPFHKNAVTINPLFDGENVLEGEVVLKGRIYGVMLLKTAAELYFNKNIKYVIHRWRHKEVNHGERE